VYRWRRWFRDTPAPIRLSTGSWWLLDTDFIGESLLSGGYERAEQDFAHRFLKAGMTVIDIGAHRGFHTLFFSKKVGKRGHVISFEPSLRDRKRLELHLKINFCRNVELRDCALGEEEGSASLYVVRVNSVLNSLRPPDTPQESFPTPVPMRKLDDVLSQAQLDRIDFIKLDVEGGELGVLKGAERLLQRIPRPVILCEVVEQRTRPWGHPGRLVIEHLSQRGFVWFELNACGELLLFPDGRSEFNGNFVAVPNESLKTLEHLRSRAHHSFNTQASRESHA
jgi:FkbM family methyltransferase